jgi:DNA polymerase-3 subunit epsilon
MNNFTAIDFETANEQPSSVCSVGVVVVRNGEISDTIYRLIKPEPEYYLFRNTRIHGLSMRDTEDAKVFSHVWKEIMPGIEGLPWWHIIPHLMKAV